MSHSCNSAQDFFFFNHRGKCWMHPSYIVSGFFETECSECVCLKETEDINALIFSNHYIYSHSKKQPIPFVKCNLKKENYTQNKPSQKKVVLTTTRSHFA